MKKINHLVIIVTIEVEVKFRVANLEDIEYQLLEWGAKLVEIVVQRDHYFNHPSRDFAKSDEALRMSCHTIIEPSSLVMTVFGLLPDVPQTSISSGHSMLPS